jgi:hypothetical protein
MAGAGARTRKDGTPSAKVGSRKLGSVAAAHFNSLKAEASGTPKAAAPPKPVEYAVGGMTSKNVYKVRRAA